jgi:AcrR family transcriptional regulator
MDTSAKPKRSYHSAKRQRQARETRMQILTAAQALFTKSGYAGATIEAIAAEAGVAPETVFSIFSNKRTILSNLVGVMVGGDDQPVALLERPGPQKVFAETNVHLQINLFAHDIANILERVAPIFEIIRVAAKIEPGIAELFHNILKERLKNLRIFVQHVAAHGPLRAGMDEQQASETVWALTSPEVFTLLVVERAWGKEKYIQWLGDSLNRLLLD